MKHVPATGLDVQMPGVGVGSGVATPPRTPLSSPLLPVPDDELDVTVLPVGKVSRETVTSVGGRGSPVDGTATGVHRPRITAMNTARVETTEATPTRICATEVGADARAPGRRRRARPRAADVRPRVVTHDGSVLPRAAPLLGPKTAFSHSGASSTYLLGPSAGMRRRPPSPQLLRRIAGEQGP